MKQRITREQVLSLNEEQREKLRELWKPKDFDIFIYYNGLLDNYQKAIVSDDGFHKSKEVLPILSIGQMIEILVPSEMAMYVGGWALEDGINMQDELCDALFEALKEVL